MTYNYFFIEKSPFSRTYYVNVKETPTWLAQSMWWTSKQPLPRHGMESIPYMLRDNLEFGELGS